MTDDIRTLKSSKIALGTFIQSKFWKAETTVSGITISNTPQGLEAFGANASKNFTIDVGMNQNVPLKACIDCVKDGTVIVRGPSGADEKAAILNEQGKIMFYHNNGSQTAAILKLLAFNKSTVQDDIIWESMYYRYQCPAGLTLFKDGLGFGCLSPCKRDMDLMADTSCYKPCNTTFNQGKDADLQCTYCDDGLVRRNIFLVGERCVKLAFFNLVVISSSPVKSAARHSYSRVSRDFRSCKSGYGAYDPNLNNGRGDYSDTGEWCAHRLLH